MSEHLPDGCEWRRPTVDDAAAIFDVIAAYNTAVIGSADYTLADTRDQLTEPGLDLNRDAWIVAARDGEVVAFATATDHGDGDEVQIEVMAHDSVIGDWLFGQCLVRAEEIAAGSDGMAIDVAIYREDATQRARLEEHGFGPATTFLRMRIDHADVVAEPSIPDGIEVERGPGDEAFRRTAHAVLNDSFADHFGFVARPFDDWHERVEASATHDWSQLRVAFANGAPVAVLAGNDAFVEDEDCGYVSHVGVVAFARGQGVAQLLLRQAFAEDARRGRTGTLLHVDANNTTPALDLYLSVGMRSVQVVDVLRRHS